MKFRPSAKKDLPPIGNKHLLALSLQDVVYTYYAVQSTFDLPSYLNFGTFFGTWQSLTAVNRFIHFRQTSSS